MLLPDPRSPDFYLLFLKLFFQRSSVTTKLPDCITCASLHFLKFETCPSFPGCPALLFFWFLNIISQSPLGPSSSTSSKKQWFSRLSLSLFFRDTFYWVSSSIHHPSFPQRVFSEIPCQGSGLPLFVLLLHHECILNYCCWFLALLFHFVVKARMVSVCRESPP